MEVVILLLVLCGILIWFLLLRKETPTKTDAPYKLEATQTETKIVTEPVIVKPIVPKMAKAPAKAPAKPKTKAPAKPKADKAKVTPEKKKPSVKPKKAKQQNNNQ